MKFKFNKQEFDANKPICVLGFKIDKHWWAYSKNSSFDRQCIHEYGAKVKKFYVYELRFEMICSQNKVKAMKLITTKQDDSVWIDEQNIIGHSPQECLKLYKAIQEG